MSDLISRQVAIEIIQSMYPGMPRAPWMRKDWQKRYEPYIRTENAIRKLPSAEKEEIIRCKDCEHRPTREYENERDGLNLRFPDGVCPCQCDDPFYSWMPSDNWYCGNAKRKEK